MPLVRTVPAGSVRELASVYRLHLALIHASSHGHEY